jgi:hypothetical protein
MRTLHTAGLLACLLMFSIGCGCSNRTVEPRLVGAWKMSAGQGTHAELLVLGGDGIGFFETSGPNPDRTSAFRWWYRDGVLFLRSLDEEGNESKGSPESAPVAVKEGGSILEVGGNELRLPPGRYSAAESRVAPVLR